MTSLKQDASRNSKATEKAGLSWLAPSAQQLSWLICKLFTRPAARLLLLLLIAASVAIAYVKPDHGWDVVAYVGAAVQDRFTSVEDLHKFTFDEVQRTVTPEAWDELIDGGHPWRVAAYASPETFASSLQLYSVKFLFVEAVEKLGPLIGLGYAPWVLGFLFGILSILAAYAFLVRLDLERYFVLFVPVLLAATFPDLLRNAGPDSMNCFFLLAGAYAYAFASRPWGYVLFALAVLTRPDSLVFVVALVLVQAVRRDISLREGAAALLCPLAYLLATTQAHHAGWWTHFYYTHIEYVDLNGFDIPFAMSLYAEAVARYVAQMFIRDGWFHVYLLLLGLYCLVWLSTGKERSVWDAMILASVLSFGARMAVFPYMSGRIMCFTAAIAGLALMARAAPFLRRLEQDLLTGNSTRPPSHSPHRLPAQGHR